jgi:hypothetical protein
LKLDIEYTGAAAGVYDGSANRAEPWCGPVRIVAGGPFDFPATPLNDIRIGAVQADHFEPEIKGAFALYCTMETNESSCLAKGVAGCLWTNESRYHHKDGYPTDGAADYVCEPKRPDIRYKGGKHDSAQFADNTVAYGPHSLSHECFECASEYCCSLVSGTNATMFDACLLALPDICGNIVIYQGGRFAPTADGPVSVDGIAITAEQDLAYKRKDCTSDETDAGLVNCDMNHRSAVPQSNLSDSRRDECFQCKTLNCCQAMFAFNGDKKERRACRAMV